MLFADDTNFITASRETSITKRIFGEEKLPQLKTEITTKKFPMISSNNSPTVQESTLFSNESCEKTLR